jgi:rhodanese-related sulfurtransferase
MIVAVTCVTAQQPLTHTQEPLEKVKENIQSGKAILVDVRELNEWQAGHLKAARLIPQSKLRDESQRAELLKDLPKDKIIYTHCRAGGRALACGEILRQLGYDVRPLKAGFEALVQAGFEKDEATKP